jgi:hypothetical protein
VLVFLRNIFFKNIFWGFLLINCLHYNIEQGLTVLVESRSSVEVELSRQNFFILTSRPLSVEDSLNADLEIHPFAWRGVSTSSHPTALASQVPWITGESQISRPVLVFLRNIKTAINYVFPMFRT